MPHQRYLRRDELQTVLVDRAASAAPMASRAARDAYRSYLLAYASHAHKDIFDVHSLDLQAVSESFGFAVPPRVDLNLSHRGDKKTRRNPKKGDRRKGQSGHAFSAANPYGKKSAGDARQFSY